MSSQRHRARILVVDDDRAFRLSTAELLRQDQHDVVAVEDGPSAVDILRSQHFDLILMDLRMPGPDGLTVVEALRRWGEGAPILMITGFGTVDTAVTALHTGVDDFLTKPVDPDLLSSRVAELLNRRPNADSGRPDAFTNIVGRTPIMEQVFDAIHRVAAMTTTVLITGETGTGKEMVARAIHDVSERRTQPFVAVNCASMPEGTLESELFGHLRGAFTGAVRDRRGLFESAHGGTVFLDEIGDTSLTVQQRLLRVLQEREVTAVGSTKATKVDVRVVAATNRDLEASVAQGLFREDLYYRLNVFRLALPPLRERRPDIPLLVESLIARLRQLQEFASVQCSPLAMRLLRAYHWPGNVRELFSAIESSAIRSGGQRIEAQHLPQHVREANDVVNASNDSRYRAPVDDERAAIVHALEEAKGVRARAAELLGMGRTTLWRKLKYYGLE